MKVILEDYQSSEYRILYVHQNDKRNFNRGAMKNIGFLYVKDLYPNDYKNITLVFNDVDTMPNKKGLFHYETKFGIIKHFYGYLHTLGGIISITGADFEKIQGFPNFWAWGYEDNAIYRRATIEGLKIDRSEFYPIQDPNMIHLKNGTIRQINQIEFDRYVQEMNNNKIFDGIDKISNLEYSFDSETNFVNVTKFSTAYTQVEQYNSLYDTNNGTQPYKTKTKLRRGGLSKSLGMLM